MIAAALVSAAVLAATPKTAPPKAAPPARPAAAASAEGTATRFHEAGSAYERGALAEALALYEGIAAEGRTSPALCYNTGNTHWRLGRRGLAILWWERARRLAPRDADTRFNLELGRSALEDEEPSAWESLDRVLTPRELAAVVTLLFWLLCGIAGVALWRDVPWPRWRRFVIAGLPLLLAFSVWLGLRWHDLSRPWGVVVAPTVEIRSGPGDQFPVGFTAPEGQRIVLLARRPGWVEVGVPSRSLKGWVVDSAVSLI